MAYVERPTFTQAIPPEARIRTEKGEQFAFWTDRLGNAVKALVLAGGRCRRTVPGKWVGYYRDHRGKKCKTQSFGDRSHALQTAIRLEQTAKAVREGREPADRPRGKVLLIDCVDEYTASRRARGTGEKWAGRVNAELRRLIARHGLTTPGAVDCEQLAIRIDLDRQAGPPEGERGHGTPYSARTRNKWVVCLRGFGHWLRQTKRTPHNPFDGLSQTNAEKDRRRERRAIDGDAFAALVTAARESADVMQGLNGIDRSMMYTLAAYTGLRAGALLRLTPEAFTWANGLPMAVYSSARLQKGKGAHGIGITPDIAGTLAEWLRTRMPGVPIFRGNAHMRTAEMLRHDLASARDAWIADGKTRAERERRARTDTLSYRNAAGEVFDFHSLRVQTGYFMRVGGVPFVAAVEILDHSDPKLTAKIYSKFGGELGAEMAKMPVPAGVNAPSLGATLGANGFRPVPSGGNLVNKKVPAKTKKTDKS